MEKGTEEFFDDVAAYFQYLESCIKNAREQVDVNTYIIHDDAVGNMIVDRLKEAASRGVRCRLLVDGFGSREWIRAVGFKMNHPGLEIRVFNPLPRFSFKNFIHWFRNGQPIWSRINRRDHKKLIIVDKKQCFVGSINLTQNSYFQREAALISTYPKRQCQEYFRYTWERSFPVHHPPAFPLKLKVPKVDIFPDNYLRCNFNYATRRRNNSRFYEAIRNSKERVWLMTPYLLPSLRLLKELAKAKKRGVDVKIIIPEKSDLKFMNWVSRYYLPFFIRHDVHVLEYYESFLHAKINIIDDIYTVGSSNLDHRSIFTNLEIDLFIQHEINKQKILASTKQTIENSNRAKIKLTKRGFMEKIVTRIIILIEKANRI